MRQILLISILLISFGMNSFSQTSNYYISPSDSLSLSDDIGDKSMSEKPFDKLRLQPMLQMGTSFSSFWGTPFMSGFVSPALRFQPPGKFSLIVGTSFTFSNNMYQFSGNEGSEPGYYEKMASYQLYAMGAYQVNENLQVRGGFSVSYMPGVNPSMMEPTMKQGHFGFDLKLSDKTWISADFNFGEGYGMYSPFHNSYNFYNTSMPGFYPYGRGF